MANHSFSATTVFGVAAIALTFSVAAHAGPTADATSTLAFDPSNFEPGVRVEDRFDNYAQDRDGHVWPMGEDVPNFGFDQSAREFGFLPPGIGLTRVEEDLDEGLMDPPITFELNAVSQTAPQG